MKKNLFLVAIIAIFTVFSANAQFGKALKNVGKAVGNVAGTVAGDIAKDMAITTLSDHIVVWLDKNNTVSADDSPYSARLASIVGTDYVTVDGLSLNYKVYENPEINILALSDGCIRVYSGLLDVFSDDEVAAIIATQIGHIVNKDTNDALLKTANKGQASDAAVAQLEKMLSLSGEKLGTVVNELIQVPYTDAQNKAADKYAASLLKKNGKNTDALVSVLKKLAEVEAADTEALANEEAVSVAYKYNKVNSNNAGRANLAAGY